MKFRATFKENPFLVFVLIIGFFAVWVGTAHHKLAFAVIGGAIIAFIFVIRVRFYVAITEEILEARGFLSTRRVRWVDIHQIRHKVEEGYMPSRLFGPAAYEFVATNAVLKINFKLFSRLCYVEVFKRVPLATAST
jgi:hypothetical protein